MILVGLIILEKGLFANISFGADQKGAKIAKRAYAEGKSLKEVALEETDLNGEELDKILNPMKLTK